MTLVSPVAVPFASGPAFPTGRDNRNPPDPQYAAEKAIDGNPDTFCCLLDDTLTGQSTTTIPARASAPVTGHMVFDLGKPMVVLGVKLTGRKDAGGMNPKNVDFYFFSDDKLAANTRVADLEHDPHLRPLLQRHSFPALGPGAIESVFWNGVPVRYVGMRVKDSYACGNVHHNYQIAEIEFFVTPMSKEMTVGAPIPPIYARQPSLPATLLETRKRYRTIYGSPREAMPPAAGSTDGTEALWSSARRDFPPEENLLLEYLGAEWLGCSGWFSAANGTDLEKQLVRRAVRELGSDGQPFQKELDGLERVGASGEDPQWLVLCARAAEAALGARELRSLRLAIEDLGRDFPTRFDAGRYSRLLANLERRLIELTRTEGELGTAAVGAWLRELRALQRDALVHANPLLAPGQLLFVKRYTYAPGWYYADFMRASRFGGGLYILSLADGKLIRLAPELEGGIFDRFDISFDARRVVFGYKGAPGKGFRLWEVHADGTGLRQVTLDPPDEPQRIAKYWHPLYKESGVYRHHTDDFHPCYLPDGGICFASTRCERGVLCDESDSLAVNVLYRVEADGSRMRRLSENALSESTPSVMNDGRILYTRWEYVDKGVIAVQALWAMRPDGTGAREVYGNDVELPPVLIHGRAIPGEHHLFVATATMHHPFAVGPILLIDARRDVRTQEPLRSLTPDTDLCVIGKDGRPHAEHYAHLQNGRWVNDDCGPLFADPYPLTDPETGAGAGKYFLATCNPDRPWHDSAGYGLWLIDVFGNRVPIYRDPQISCWQPVLLRPRPRPPVIPQTTTEGVASREELPKATLVLHDVYAGLTGVPRGTVKYLRILEQVPRPWAARRFWPDDSAFGQHAVVSLNAHIHVKLHHGVVPVREDGSAHFQVPSNKNLFFQALDENFMEVQRMRSFVNLSPGEVRSCVGCHPYRPKAPHNAPVLAIRFPPDELGPQPGEVVPRPIHYPTDVQPILDKHCVRCHDSQRPEDGLVLSGEMTQYFSRSYETLMNHNLVACIQEFYGPQPDAQITNVAPLAPQAVGSHASRLIAVLSAGHFDVKLSREEFVRIITWIDANGPYYGSYFGRRNLRYKDHPDFRPVPSLESASGKLLGH